MQQRGRYPDDVLTGGCFISGDYSTAEPIVDLDIYVETLPPFGRLCVSAKGVRMLVAAMGWELMSDFQREEYDEAHAEVDRLTVENRALRGALAKLIDVAALVDLVKVAELSDIAELEPVS